MPNNVIAYLMGEFAIILKYVILFEFGCFCNGLAVLQDRGEMLISYKQSGRSVASHAAACNTTLRMSVSFSPWSANCGDRSRVSRTSRYGPFQT